MAYVEIAAIAKELKVDRIAVYYHIRKKRIQKVSEKSGLIYANDNYTAWLAEMKKTNRRGPKKKKE